MAPQAAPIAATYKYKGHVSDIGDCVGLESSKEYITQDAPAPIIAKSAGRFRSMASSNRRLGSPTIKPPKNPTMRAKTAINK